MLNLEPALIEIDPKMLEEEVREEEMLKKELEQEAKEKKREKETKEDVKEAKTEVEVGLDEMLAKKHYQSTVSISNISFGDDFESSNQGKKEKKKSERFILNRPNYHHPRKPRNKVLELYKDGKTS